MCRNLLLNLIFVRETVISILVSVRSGAQRRCHTAPQPHLINCTYYGKPFWYVNELNKQSRRSKPRRRIEITEAKLVYYKLWKANTAADLGRAVDF